MDRERVQIVYRRMRQGTLTSFSSAIGRVGKNEAE